jgi:transposase
LLPTVSVAAFNRALAAFAHDTGAGPTKRVVLLLDRAGWHVSRKAEVPDGLHLIFLPPSSPELQPAERLWPLTNEPVANRHFADLDTLEEVLAERCRTLLAQPETIRAHTRYHWWPTEEAAYLSALPFATMGGIESRRSIAA